MVSDKSRRLDQVFHALAHPARRTMLRQLAHRERSVGELASPLAMSFPAASKHVRVLERAALVKRRVIGRTHWCRLRPSPLKEAAQWIEAYRRQWEAKLQALEALLIEMQAQPARALEPLETRHGQRG
jgi:DNA-binding transcriptional ArsR family regulator